MLSSKVNPLSSVVFFGEVQRSQASKAETSTFCIKSVNFSVLAFQKLLDPFGTFLLKCGQFLFNLQSLKNVIVILSYRPIISAVPTVEYLDQV